MAGSVQTTLAGLLLGLSMIFGEVHKMLDADPGTVMDVNVLAGGLGAIWLGLKAQQTPPKT